MPGNWHNIISLRLDDEGTTRQGSIVFIGRCSGGRDNNKSKELLQFHDRKNRIKKEFYGVSNVVSALTGW